MAKACATQSITKLVFLTLKAVRKQWQLTNELILIKTPATTLCKTCVAFKRFTNAYVFVIYDFKKYLFPVNRTLFIQPDERRQTETKDTKKLPPSFPRSCWKLCCWKSRKVQRIKQKRNRCLVDSIVEHLYLSDKDFTTCLQCVILMFLLLISPTTWLKISRQEPKSCSRKHYLLHDKHLKITKGNIDPFP